MESVRQRYPTSLPSQSDDYEILRFDGSGWDIDGFIERQRTESLSQTEDDSSMPPSEAESSESDEKRLNGKKRKKKKKKELELLNKELENSNNNEESSIQSQVPLDNDKIVASEDRTENFNSGMAHFWHFYKNYIFFNWS